MEQEAFNLKEYSTNHSNLKILKISVQTIHARLVFATNQIKLFAVGVVTPTEQEWSNHPPLSPFKGGRQKSKKNNFSTKNMFQKLILSPLCEWNGESEGGKGDEKDGDKLGKLLGME